MRGTRTPHTVRAVAPDPPIGVALVADELPLGGAESLQLRVLAGLDPARFRPMAVCLRTPGVMADRFEAAGVPVHVMGRSGRRHLTTVPALARLLRAHDARAVLLTPHDATMALAPFAARLAGAGTALGLHQTGGRTIGIPSFPHRSVEWTFLVDVLVLLTRAQADYLRAEEGFGSRPWRRTRVAYIPNGVEIPPPATPEDRLRARAALGVAAEDEVVGILAALRPEKDHETLLRAVARLAGDRARLRLVLIGSGDREAALREAAAGLGIADRVVFAGFRPDAVALLAGLDVACLVSVQETYPTSVLEAMAAGVPVVMTETPGVPDLVGDGIAGLRVPVGDDRAVADAIAGLLDDPDRRARMGRAGRDLAAREHPISRTVERYGQVLAAVATKRRGRGRGTGG